MPTSDKAHYVNSRPHGPAAAIASDSSPGRFGLEAPPEEPGGMVTPIQSRIGGLPIREHCDARLGAVCFSVKSLARKQGIPLASRPALTGLPSAKLETRLGGHKVF